MQWKVPKNSNQYCWTAHVVGKMRYYGLSEQKVLGVIRNPKRIETGIVENTVAVMVPAGNIKKNRKLSKWNHCYNDEGKLEKWSQEIWVMYQIKAKSVKLKVQSKNPKIHELQEKIISNKKIIIISAWRYPGISPKNNPIPEEILNEIEEIGLK